MYNQQSREEGFFSLNIWLFMQVRMDSFVTAGIRLFVIVRISPFTSGFQFRKLLYSFYSYPTSD